jgi:hypothetical protein
MHIHDATEEAYKNGYEAGVKKFAERLKSHLIIYTYLNLNGVIDNLVKEMTEQKE